MNMNWVVCPRVSSHVRFLLHYGDEDEQCTKKIQINTVDCVLNEYEAQNIIVLFFLYCYLLKSNAC